MRLAPLVPLVASLALAAADAASDVIDLTSTTFDSTVNPEPLMLVEFFAPWCGHCKALAPQYEEAATELKGKNIKLAKVDCTVEQDLCSENGVRGYPTLKVFRNGTPSDYAGPRKADGIISYMNKQALPAVSEVTADNHDSFKTQDKVVLVSYASKDSPVSRTFHSIANKLRDEFLFGEVTDPALASAAGVTPPAVALYKQFDEGRNDADVSDFTEESFAAFLKENSLPLVDEIGPENFAIYAEAGIPLAYLFVDPEDSQLERYINELRTIAKDYKGKINFVWIDGIKFVDHGKSLNLVKGNWPGFVIQNIQEQTKFPFSEDKSLTPESLADFVRAFTAGEIAPSIKSAPVPESNGEPVTVLVADIFNEIVYDDEKDVFAEFYAPWCGHCKRLAPTWDTLGEKYSDDVNVVIAKMDATENDVPPSAPFSVSGFPTLKFKAAGAREWIDYNGDRSLESLYEFVEENRASTPKAPAAADASSTTAAKEAEKTEAHHDEL